VTDGVFGHGVSRFDDDIGGLPEGTSRGQSSRLPSGCSSRAGEAVNLQVPLESTIDRVRLWLGERGSRLPWRARWTFVGLPPRCFFCEAEGDLGFIDLCADCLTTLPWAADADAHASTLSVLAYRDPIDDALKALKDRGDRRAARRSGGRLAAAARDLAAPDILVPVPLHPDRVCSRGFNQSLLIATHTGHWLQRPVRPNWISRLRATPSQTGLHAAERRLNVEGAFVVSADAQEEIESSGVRRVALIDDVITTGATLDAARHALLEAGVADVQRWAVARAMLAKSTIPT